MYENRLIEEPSKLNNQVTIIHKAEDSVPGSPSFRKKRVAAYCRVSTKLEIQQSSLELQMESYQKIIEDHPDWELAGIYADKGLTGTQSKNRVEFQRMMEDARQKKIDMILVKSVSRFARNTSDSLRYTQELRSMGIGVYFEKEGIDTSSFASDFMLTIFSAFAQEESHSISENIKRGLRNRYKIGVVPWYTVYGYRNGWVIEHSEAEVVRKIFFLYADGLSGHEIAKELNNEGVPSPRNDVPWSHRIIVEILKNEKYTGDARMQKTYVEDFMTHKRAHNSDAKIEQYYKKNNHEAIVDRDLFNKVQKIMSMRNPAKGATLFPYYGFLKCPCCGNPMIKVWIAGTIRQSAWTCGGEGPKEVLRERTNCPTFLLQERVMERTLRTAVLKLDKTENKNFSHYKAILEAQNSVLNSEVLSYHHLQKLIKEISLSDWESLRILWQMGWTGDYPLNFTRAAEAVMPDLQLKDGSIISSFPMNNKIAFLEGFRTRQINALKTRVITPHDSQSEIPIVLRGA